MTLLQFCHVAISEMKSADSAFADVFVRRRLQLQRDYLRGIVLSTAHGADIFHNIINALAGVLKWDEKGEYGTNFRAFIVREGKITS